MSAKSNNSGKNNNPMPDVEIFETDFLRTQQMLKEAMEQQKIGLDGLTTTRPLLFKVLCRIVRLQEQIDAAFGGQSFNPKFGPLSPANTPKG